MQLSDFYPEFKGWVPAQTADKSAPQVPDDRLQSSAYLRAPLPLPLQYAPDTLKQYYRPGLSSFRNAPQSPSSFPAINSAAKSAVTAAIATAIANAPPSSGSGNGVTSVGLTAPSALFATPVSGSPITTSGVLALALVQTSPSFFFAGPPGTQGVIALDNVGANKDVDGTRTAASLTVSTTALQANDFAMLAMTNFSSGSTVTTPDASWTQLIGMASSTIPNLGVWWKIAPTAGTVSGSVSLSGPAGNMDLVGSIATVKSTGSPSSRQNRNTGLAGVVPGVGNTLAYVSNLLAASASFVVMVGLTTGINDWIITDSQNNQYTLVAFSAGQGTGPFPRSIYIFAAPTTSAAACTVTATYAGTASSTSGVFFITEVTNLSPAVFTPVFRPIVTQDLPGFGTGKLDVLHGGTGADLTATGGASQVLQQTSVGGAITVGQLDYTNLQGVSAATKYKNVTLVASGLVSEVAQVNLTAQTAAVATTTLYAVPAAGVGQYNVSWNAKVTTVAGVSSTLGPLTIVYTDPDGVVQTITCVAQSSAGVIETSDAGNLTTTVLLGIPLLLNCKASTNITYAFAYASNAANAMNYNLHIRLEAM